jgi:uncharacterized membrane protein YfcA
VLPPLLAVSVLGGLIGPRLLEKISKFNLQPIIGVVLLLMLIPMLINHNLGTIKKTTKLSRKIFGGLILFLIMIFATMFGIGGGTFLIYSLIYFFGMTVIKANANGMVMWLIGAVTAFVSYASQGDVNYQLGIPLLIGAAFGGYIGAQLAIKKGTAWIK